MLLILVKSTFARAFSMKYADPKVALHRAYLKQDKKRAEIDLRYVSVTTSLPFTEKANNHTVQMKRSPLEARPRVMFSCNTSMCERD